MHACGMHAIKPLCYFICVSRTACCPAETPAVSGPLSAVPHGSTDKVAELKQLVQQDAPDPAATADTDKKQQKGKKQQQKQQEKQQHDPQQAAQQLAAVLGVDGRAAQQLLEQEPGLASIGQQQLKVRCGKQSTCALLLLGSACFEMSWDACDSLEAEQLL
jgi:hypothetical protein